MNAYEKWMDADAWLAVVDGELSPSQLREMVAVCDLHPELWKRCAVAFLEEQALAQEMKSLAWPTAAVIANETTISTSEVDRRDERPLAMMTSAHGSAKSPASKKIFHRHILLNNLALAATILLAFVIGWQSSLRLGTKESPALVESPESRGHVPDTSLASSSTDAIEFAFDRPEDVVPFDRTIPKELAELVRLGVVDVKSNDGFVPVRLDDGNAAIVPFHRYQVHPVRKAY